MLQAKYREEKAVDIFF